MPQTSEHSLKIIGLSQSAQIQSLQDLIECVALCFQDTELLPLDKGHKDLFYW